MWTCKKCKKTWHYSVKKCIFCGGDVKRLKVEKIFVDSSTKVFIPSSVHKDAPYFVTLLKDEHGNFHIRKTKKEYKFGDEIKKKEALSKFKVGVIGTGSMGLGLTELLLQHKMEVVIKSRSQVRIKEIRKKVEQNLIKYLDINETKEALSNFHLTVNYSDLRECNIIIECSVENFEIKKRIFQELEQACLQNTILTSNTSSFSIKDLVKNSKKPGRIIGLHFFNPVSKMRLVEIVKTNKTSIKNLRIIKNFALSINKEPIVVIDSPGFIVNRILMPYLNEAVFLLSKGVAKKEDIDKAAKLGLNYPLGPFRLLDLIGLDIYLDIMNNLYKETKDKKFKVISIIEQMVKKNKLGKKTGEGFYKYK